MSLKQFERFLQEIREQEMDEAYRLDDPIYQAGRRFLKPDELYKPFDPRVRQPQSEGPFLSKRAHNCSINDLYRACQSVGARHNMAMEVVRVENEDTCIWFSGTMFSGNFSGMQAPSVAAITSSMQLAIQELSPRAVLELMDQSDIPVDGPGAYRRRGVWRLMSTSGDGRGRKP